jgi:hypothetical protein
MMVEVAREEVRLLERKKVRVRFDDSKTDVAEASGTFFTLPAAGGGVACGRTGPSRMAAWKSGSAERSPFLEK